MQYQKYAAEFLGTFALTFCVWLSVIFEMPFMTTAVLASITLGLFVYMVGGISGAHLNPAVSIGILSAGKLKTNDAVMYVVCQLAGAAVAMTLGRLLTGGVASVAADTTLVAGIAEALGAFFLTFAVMSVTLQKVPPAANGFVVGGSLLMGTYIAYHFSNAILNPAVALGISSFGPIEILGPIVGAVGGAWARKSLEGGK